MGLTLGIYNSDIPELAQFCIHSHLSLIFLGSRGSGAEPLVFGHAQREGYLSAQPPVCQGNVVCLREDSPAADTNESTQPADHGSTARGLCHSRKPRRALLPGYIWPRLLWGFHEEIEVRYVHHAGCKQNIRFHCSPPILLFLLFLTWLLLLFQLLFLLLRFLLPCSYSLLLYLILL